MQAVKNVLQKYIPEQEWHSDVIERAHHLGKPNSRNQNARPIIAKFQRWGDAMILMKNCAARGDMERDGLRVSQDLTRWQSKQLQKLRDKGRSGYYVNGKLRINEASPLPAASKVNKQSEPMPYMVNDVAVNPDTQLYRPMRLPE